MNRMRTIVAVGLGVTALAAGGPAGCGPGNGDHPASGAVDGDVRRDFADPDDLVVSEEDGLARLAGADEPFTGVAVERDADWRMRYFGNFEDGRLHGPEIRWFPGGTIRRIYDYHRGAKVRHRVWFENGTLNVDAAMEDGVAIGRHRVWAEDGSVRFDGSFAGNLQWDGPTLAVGEDGTVLWDAVFEKGRFVSGRYPVHEEEILLEKGIITPEHVRLRTEGDGVSVPPPGE